MVVLGGWRGVHEKKSKLQVPTLWEAPPFSTTLLHPNVGSPPCYNLTIGKPPCYSLAVGSPCYNLEAPPATTVLHPNRESRHGYEPRKREFFIDNLLIRIHLIIEMAGWTGPAPWEFEFPYPGSFVSTNQTSDNKCVAI